MRPARFSEQQGALERLSDGGEPGGEPTVGGDSIFDAHHKKVVPLSALAGDCFFNWGPLDSAVTSTASGGDPPEVELASSDFAVSAVDFSVSAVARGSLCTPLGPTGVESP